MKKLVLFSVRTNLQGADGGVVATVTICLWQVEATHPSKDAHIPTPEPVTQVTFPEKQTLQMGLRG